MEHAVFDSTKSSIRISRDLEIDSGMPEWARRSNPIVRRHLGEYWKTMSIDYLLLVKIFLGNLVFVLVTLPFPFLLTMIMPTVMVSIVLLPIVFVMYAQALVLIGIAAATTVSDERRNDSLDLMRVSPRPMREILYSKIAAAIWRQLENLSLIITTAALFSLPLLMIQYQMTEAFQEQPVLMCILMMVALASILVRIFLETAMVGAIGTVVGASTTIRATAVLTTTLFSAAYFAFINLMRLLDMPIELRLMVEIVLPLLLPVLIILVCLRMATYLLTRDA